ncbi:MAG TPA: MerR family transcriptional regulator [Actinocrinis sp.]|nr:MerR family transcriptional regulator [Actinocrinis sp.]
MQLLTIGAFARATRLSIKALRLYDEFGLLRPVRVDPVSGYRYYAPEQVERARLVLWLRRLGMPLAGIREVCEQPPAGAADLVRSFWAQAEADVAARRDLAAFLVDHLNGKDTAMTATTTAPLEIRYAALSDIGLVRPRNQDTAYAGPGLLAVADGFGGNWGSAPLEAISPAAASEAAIDAFKRLEPGIVQAADLLNALQDAVDEADRAVLAAAATDSGGEVDPGTTLTAMLWTGSQLALAHIGDSRAYLLRDGELFQITHDHTVVQSLIDEGKLSRDEAASHPQRSLLTRALDGKSKGQPELQVHGAQAGDRYLLSTDGLTTMVTDEELLHILSTVADPEEAVRQLVAQANQAGGPDNIACVVADVVEPARQGDIRISL